MKDEIIGDADGEGVDGSGIGSSSSVGGHELHQVQTVDRKGSIDITSLNLSFSIDDQTDVKHEYEAKESEDVIMGIVKKNFIGSGDLEDEQNKGTININDKGGDVNTVTTSSGSGNGIGIDEGDGDDISPLRKSSMDMSVLGTLRKTSMDMSVLDTLSSSLDHIVKGTNASININGRKDSDASALIGTMASLRKESDASALYSLSSLRKDSDVSALSTLVRDEEEMMLKEEHDEDINLNMNMPMHLDNIKKPEYHTTASSATGDDDLSNINRKYSDPFENLRKLSDASDNVLRKLSDSSDVISLRNLRKDSDGDDGATLEAFKTSTHDDHHNHQIHLKSPGGSINTSASGGIGFGLLGEMKKDDASIGASLFDDSHHHDPHDLKAVEPNPVFVASTLKGSDIHVSAQLDTIDSDKNSDDGSVITINAANQRMLMDALLDPTSSSSNHHSHRRNRAESWGGMSDISLPHTNAVIASTADIQRGPSPHDFGGLMSPSSNNSLNDSSSHHLHYDRQENVAKRRSRSGSITDIPGKIAVTNYSTTSTKSCNSSVCSNQNSKSKEQRDRSDSFSVSQIQMPKPLRDRAGSFTGKRLRLDSWGARDRIDSISASRDRLDSLANLSGIFSRGRDRLDSLASLGEVSLSMSLGDLEDVAGKLESIVHGDEESSACDDSVSGSENAAAPNTSKSNSSSLPAPTIQVDSEAVQSAVQAAMAATSGGVLDLLNINSTPGKTPRKAGAPALTPSKLSTPVISNSKLKHPVTTTPIQSTPMDEAKMEEIRARARAAAGYVHPGNAIGHKPPAIKSKKRPLPSSVQPSFKKFVGGTGPGSQYSTPVAASKFVNAGKVPSGVHMYSDFTGSTPKRKAYPSTTKSTPSSTSKGGQSNQKWEEMFECLVVYVKEQRIKETANMPEEDKAKWEWSGNVPTMYKTKDGKALGRWINNQRSAKSKGSLKVEREQRLVSTGLKWSVLTTNAWTDMMEELKIYVREKTKDGNKWDGNVPTNYKIKNTNRGDGNDGEEDKNLGRWINRQRSLYQAGKLKEERRKQLENIGLKWAVLSTTSWHTMYDALCRYAKARKDQDKNGFWDGNVPASYETNDKPAKKLGRWINRQRSAYANKKLKKEFVDKLEKVGLKWTAMDSKKDMETSEILLRQRVMAQPIRPVAQGARTVMQTVRPGVTSTARPMLVKSGTVVRQVVRHGVGTVRPGVISRPGTTNVGIVGRTGVHPATVISSKAGMSTTVGNTKVTVLPQARPLTVVSSKVGTPTTVGSGKVTVLPQTRPGTLTPLGNRKVTTLPHARPITIVSAKAGVPGNAKATTLSQVRQTTIISSKPGMSTTVGGAKVTTIPQVRQPIVINSKQGVSTTMGNAKVTALSQARPITVISAKSGVATTSRNPKVTTAPQVRHTTTIASKHGVPTLVGNTRVTNLPQVQKRTIVTSKPGVRIIGGNTKVTTVPQVRHTTTISSQPGTNAVGNTKVTTIPQVRQPTIITSKPGTTTVVTSKKVSVPPQVRQATVIITKPGVPTTVGSAKGIDQAQAQARPISLVTSKPGVPATTGKTNVSYKSQQLATNQTVRVTRPVVTANQSVVPSSKIAISTTPATGMSNANQARSAPAIKTLLPASNATGQMKSVQMISGQMKTVSNTSTQIKSNQVKSSQLTPTAGKVIQVAPRMTPTLITASSQHVSTTSSGKVNASIATQKIPANSTVFNGANTKQLNASSSPATTNRPAPISTKTHTPIPAAQKKSAAPVGGTRPIAGVQGNASMSAISLKPVIQNLPSSLPASPAPNAPASSSALPGVASNKMC